MVGSIRGCEQGVKVILNVCAQLWQLAVISYDGGSSDCSVGAEEIKKQRESQDKMSRRWEGVVEWTPTVSKEKQMRSSISSTRQ